ncbi:4'-phosphopantetheinyl transferase superfamily protein [Mycoplasma seminis]|uniref:4'-phosphopantetheinyl transferase superfamily protein n=1 Tax=Mycoplasma seminis TaxID=512749 RepID=A0ABY9HAW9_9MOLU|nr:4'-phosphopantetheinyl transferase superfamily protein [Mycoplasma seminis]WLP85748.1 4'-phosphopantetheinyl transferase superfamily protein [Mycoplasma seminis]
MNNFGVDITNISRFLNKTTTFCNRVLSQNELEKLNQIDDAYQKARFLARSWAIKEALFKADNSLIDFRKINLQQDSQSKLWYFKDFVASISYADDYVIAFVQKKGTV